MFHVHDYYCKYSIKRKKKAEDNKKEQCDKYFSISLHVVSSQTIRQILSVNFFFIFSFLRIDDFFHSRLSN